MRALFLIVSLLASFSANAAIQLFTNVSSHPTQLSVLYTGSNTEPCCDYIAVNQFSMRSLVSHPNLSVPQMQISHKMSPFLNASGAFTLQESYNHPCVGGPYTAFAEGYIYWDTWVQMNTTAIQSIIRQGTKTCYC